MNPTQDPCPCGNALTYAQCCQPLHQGTETAADARQLMKSRYCAYHQLAVDYLVATTAVDTRAEHQPEAIRQWAEACGMATVGHTRFSTGRGRQLGGVCRLVQAKRQAGGASRALTICQNRRPLVFSSWRIPNPRHCPAQAQRSLLLRQRQQIQAMLRSLTCRSSHPMDHLKEQ